MTSQDLAPSPLTALNAAQAAAVAHVDGPLLVFAGAGSGKTRVITYRVAHLVVSHRVPAYRILAVTFTNKAAGEMRQRLTELLGEPLARELWVGTFHATCARLLRRYHDVVGLSEKFTIYDESDQKAVLTRVLREGGYDERQLPPKQVLARIHALKQEALDPRAAQRLGRADETLRELYEGYERALAAANAVDFDDLILHVLRVAEGQGPASEELRARFTHVLVDEFQDTNQVQYRLVRALSAGTRNLCVVGDDDQSIYSWRGADVRLILGFQRDFPDAVVVKLEQNYRSTANVVAAALGVIQGARSREPKALWTEQPAGEPVRVHSLDDERAEAHWVVSTILAERRRGTHPADIAVFYRINAMSRVLEEALREIRVNYQVVGGMRFFERAEVKDLIAYLRWLDNPRSDTDLVRIINTPPRGIGDKTVEALLALASARGSSVYDVIEVALRGDALGAAAKRRLSQFQATMEELREAARSLSPSALARQVLELSGYRAALVAADTPEADARLENLEELVGSIQEYEDAPRWSESEPTLGGWLERVALVSAVDAMTQEPAVTLMTVHSAKGLEYEVVLITGMEEDIFPYRGLDGEDAHELDEERRLAYVAITRARQRLYLSWAGTRTLFGRTRYSRASRFLTDLPAAVVRWEGQRKAGGGSRPAHLGRAWGAPARRAPAPEPALAPGERRLVLEEEGQPPQEPGQAVAPGDRVRHERYGVGTVERVELRAEPVLLVDFPGYGTKKVLARFLQPA